FSNEIALGRKNMDSRLNNMHEDDRLAWIFKDLANNGQILALLLRYESTLTRTYDRAFKPLPELQKHRNEPTPTAQPAHVGQVANLRPIANRPVDAQKPPQPPASPPSRLRPLQEVYSYRDQSTRARPLSNIADRPRHNS